MDSSTRRPTTQPLTVEPVRAFEDNYVWVLCRGADAVVVDPGDAAPVARALAERALRLGAILLTHHHADHVGGVGALVAAHDAPLPVFGPVGEDIAGVTQRLHGGDRFALDAIGASFEVLDVPGHTRGHIAFVATVDGVDGRSTGVPLLFCGDTLFAGGCGRLFEGTAAQMHASLSRLAALPPETRVYCAHEYTASNLRFAKAVEPDSGALADRIAATDVLRRRDEPTLPSTIAVERATNPFLRVDEPSVRAAAERRTAGASASALATFTALRLWKDRF